MRAKQFWYIFNFIIGSIWFLHEIATFVLLIPLTLMGILFAISHINHTDIWWRFNHVVKRYTQNYFALQNPLKDSLYKLNMLVPSIILQENSCNNHPFMKNLGEVIRQIKWKVTRIKIYISPTSGQNEISRRLGSHQI